MVTVPDPECDDGYQNPYVWYNGIALHTRRIAADILALMLRCSYVRCNHGVGGEGGTR